MYREEAEETGLSEFFKVISQSRMRYIWKVREGGIDRKES